MNAKRPTGLVETDFSKASEAGLAAIFMFLQIALSGYLVYALYYLATADNALSSLRQFQAGWQYFLPAAFAARSYLPTNPLAKTIGMVAAIVGSVSWLIFAFIAGITAQQSGGDETPLAQLLQIHLECGAALLYGSALGASPASLIVQRMQKLRRPADLEYYERDSDLGAMIVMGVLVVIGLAAGAFAWHWQGDLEISTTQYAMAGAGVAGILGMSAVHGMRNFGLKVVIGIFLYAMAGSASILVGSGAPWIWFAVMATAGAIALLDAGTHIIHAFLDHAEANRYDCIDIPFDIDI